MLKFAAAGVTSFSTITLRIGVFIRLLTSLVSFGLLTHALCAKVALNATVPGWATTITVITFIFVILFIHLGVIGEYIGRVLVEVKPRPRFLVRESLGLTYKNDVKNL